MLRTEAPTAANPADEMFEPGNPAHEPTKAESAAVADQVVESEAQATEVRPPEPAGSAGRVGGGRQGFPARRGDAGRPAAVGVGDACPTAAGALRRSRHPADGRAGSGLRRCAGRSRQRPVQTRLALDPRHLPGAGTSRRRHRRGQPGRCRGRGCRRKPRRTRPGSARIPRVPPQPPRSSRSPTRWPPQVSRHHRSPIPPHRPSRSPVNPPVRRPIPPRTSSNQAPPRPSPLPRRRDKPSPTPPRPAWPMPRPWLPPETPPTRPGSARIPRVPPQPPRPSRSPTRWPPQVSRHHRSPIPPHRPSRSPVNRPAAPADPSKDQFKPGSPSTLATSQAQGQAVADTAAASPADAAAVAAAGNPAAATGIRTHPASSAATSETLPVADPVAAASLPAPSIPDPATPALEEPGRIRRGAGRSLQGPVQTRLPLDPRHLPGAGTGRRRHRRGQPGRCRGRGCRRKPRRPRPGSARIPPVPPQPPRPSRSPTRWPPQVSRHRRSPIPPHRPSRSPVNPPGRRPIPPRTSSNQAPPRPSPPPRRRDRPSPTPPPPARPTPRPWLPPEAPPTAAGIRTRPASSAATSETLPVADPVAACKSPGTIDPRSRHTDPRGTRSIRRARRPIPPRTSSNRTASSGLATVQSATNSGSGTAVSDAPAAGSVPGASRGESSSATMPGRALEAAVTPTPGGESLVITVTAPGSVSDSLLPAKLEAPDGALKAVDMARVIRKQRGKPGLETIKQMGGSDGTEKAISAAIQWLVEQPGGRRPLGHPQTRCQAPVRHRRQPASPCSASTAGANDTTSRASTGRTSATPSTGCSPNRTTTATSARAPT